MGLRLCFSDKQMQQVHDHILRSVGGRTPQATKPEGLGLSSALSESGWKTWTKSVNLPGPQTSSSNREFVQLISLN